MDKRKVAAAFLELQQELLNTDSEEKCGRSNEIGPGYEDDRRDNTKSDESLIENCRANLSNLAIEVASRQQKLRDKSLSFELSTMLATGGSFLCDNCGEEFATAFCLQCPAESCKYCDLCAKSHRSLKIFRQHVVQPISVDYVDVSKSASEETVKRNMLDTFEYISPRRLSHDEAIVGEHDVDLSPPVSDPVGNTNDDLPTCTPQTYSGGWVKYFTDDGSPYFYNEAIDESSWELPDG